MRHAAVNTQRERVKENNEILNLLYAVDRKMKKKEQNEGRKNKQNFLVARRSLSTRQTSIYMQVVCAKLTKFIEFIDFFFSLHFSSAVAAHTSCPFFPFYSKIFRSVHFMRGVHVTTAAPSSALSVALKTLWPEIWHLRIHNKFTSIEKCVCFSHRIRHACDLHASITDTFVSIRLPSVDCSVCAIYGSGSVCAHFTPICLESTVWRMR